MKVISPILMMLCATECCLKILCLVLLFMIVIVIVVGSYYIKRYLTYKEAALDYLLKNADISQRLRDMARQNPTQIPTFDDWRELRNLVESKISTFYKMLNPDQEHPLSEIEYDVCLALRVQLSPVEISKLKQCTPAYITKIRKKLLMEIFNKEDTAEVFDDEIVKIRRKNMAKEQFWNLVKSFNRYLFGAKSFFL